jgi:hypothetical protein
MPHARSFACAGARLGALSLALSLLMPRLSMAEPPDPPRDLPFSAFFAQPVGPRGLEPTPALRAADGTRVRLVGYLAVQELPVPGRWLLAPRPVQLSEHADGDADDLPPATVSVRLPAALRDRAAPHASGPVTVVGTLHLGRDEGPDGRVTWVQIDAEAP